jgi:tRNA modification GTPase
LDTIYALATVRGKAGVAVLRISGPDALTATASFCALPSERHVALRRLRWRGDILDQALVIVFNGDRSFTGEPMVELHLHGSQAVVAAVLRALSDLGLRHAEAGEFTRRALENGKIDLTQVEGLADLIEAETEAQRRQSMRVLSGAIGAIADAVKARLLRAAALLAATLDFSEEDLPDSLMTDIVSNVQEALAVLQVELQGAKAAERVRDGFEVAIIGATNVGKSSLLNALAGRDAAIISAVAGTTRDVIEVRMDIMGLPVTLLDTAGLRETDDPVEAIGIARARDRAASADLRILLDDGTSTPHIELRPGDIRVFGKSDLRPDAVGHGNISAVTGVGLVELIDAIGVELSGRVAGAATVTRARHASAISRATLALQDSLIELQGRSPQLEIAADHLAVAMRSLDSLVGRVDVEDLLDQIFSSFCIGK